MGGRGRDVGGGVGEPRRYYLETGNCLLGPRNSMQECYGHA